MNMKKVSEFRPELVLQEKGYSDETIANIMQEDLLEAGLLHRLHTCYTKDSGILNKHLPFFADKESYTGIKGFRQIVEVLRENGYEIGHLRERELFIDVYRFMATRHILNAIDWDNFEKDAIFQLVFPQPGMINDVTTQAYVDAKDDAERAAIVEAYMEKTNPHDGKQKLNKPWYLNDEDDLEILAGSQHKYPPVALIFDKTTQNCFAFCNYCFRHAQVRGDEDMFIQEDISQVHEYLAKHKEVTDVLITGGDGGYITYERLEQYALPLIENENLMHIRTLRLGTRVLTYKPEHILSDKYKKNLELFRKLKRNGVQVLLMAHFSTPRELLNPATIAAINRLKDHGVMIKSQSPIMKHISLLLDKNGEIDIDRSAQNWIDLGNILAMLGVGFHSMYCARPTGEHHYFTAPLAVINEVFSKVYRTLASINRPSRYITMTSSAGKTSMLGVAEVNGEKVFVLKFNEARNMEWMDKVFLAKYDAHENTIEKLKPFEGDKYFFAEELVRIENELEEKILAVMAR